MHRVATSLRRLPLLIFALVILSVAAFGQSNSGSINLQGTASGYVEVRAGGAARRVDHRRGFRPDDSHPSRRAAGSNGAARRGARRVGDLSV